MPSRDSTGARRRQTPAPEAPPASAPAVRVGAISVAMAAVVAIAGGGDVVWLSVPAAMAAVAACRTRIGAAAGAVAVLGLSTVSAAALTGLQARPSVALLAIVVAASGAVLVAMRERLEREREMLRDFALSDPVTGIANRRSLLLRADYEISRHERAQRSFALVMLDLDGFKQLNDRFGHAAGDDLLRDVAAALSHAMRAQDTVARFGGDEFCILAPETDEPGTAGLARKVSEAVREVSAGMDAVGGSVGVAVFPADGTTLAVLMQAADERLLEAKRRRHRGRPQRRAA
jgi:diguanylate cyclase (GGDEF)-like protein